MKCTSVPAPASYRPTASWPKLMRHIISMLMENESGALSRVAGLFSARGYNIESLTVAPTDDPSLSRMTLVTSGSEHIIEQITKQLNKLVDVLKLVDLTKGPHIEREMLLIKIATPTDSAKQEIKVLAETASGLIVDDVPASMTIEITGEGKAINDFIEVAKKADVLEVVRSGVSGIGRGDRTLHG